MAKSPDDHFVLPQMQNEAEPLDHPQGLHFSMPAGEIRNCQPELTKPDENDLPASYAYHTKMFFFHQQAVGSHFKRSCEKSHYKEALQHGQKAESLYLLNADEMEENEKFKHEFKEFLARHLCLININKRKKQLTDLSEKVERLELEPDEDYDGAINDVKQLKDIFKM